MRPFLRRGNKRGRAFDKGAGQRRARARRRKRCRMGDGGSRFAQSLTEEWRHHSVLTGLMVLLEPGAEAKRRLVDVPVATAAKR